MNPQERTIDTYRPQFTCGKVPRIRSALSVFEGVRKNEATEIGTLIVGIEPQGRWRWVARQHAAKLERLAVAIGGFAPVLLVVGAIAADGVVLPTLLCAVAALLFLVGVLVERWLFFASARHAVMNYYGG